MSPSVKIISAAPTWKNGKLNANSTVNNFIEILETKD